MFCAVKIIARSSVTGARIAHDTTDLTEDDVGTLTDLFEIKKIGDEYFAYITSEKTTAVTIVIRGPSKDIINEVERNLQDAVNVVRNVLINPKIVPGAGSLEMALAHALNEKSKTIEGVRQWPYKAVARALEVIPRTLIQNCGGSTIRQLTALRAKHAQSPDKNWTWGIDGVTGELVSLSSTLLIHFFQKEVKLPEESKSWIPFLKKVGWYKTRSPYIRNKNVLL